MSVTHQYRIYRKKFPAFTLVEILVVVTSIGIISTVIMVSITSLRAKSRDNERLATLKRLEVSLELYHNINNFYPNTSGNWYSSEPGDSITNNGGDWIPGLAPNFISVLPRDPKGGLSNNIDPFCATRKNSYRYRSNGTDFKLMSFCTLEYLDGVAESTSSIFYDPARPKYSWQVHSSPASLNW